MKKKKCSKCGEWKLADTTHFVKNKDGKYGFNSVCKECEKLYRDARKEETRLRNKKYYQAHRDELKSRQREWNANNKEHIRAYGKKYRGKHSEKIRTQKKTYREENKEEIAERKRAYYYKNHGEITAKNREYYRENAEQLRQYQSDYRRNNPEKMSQYRNNYSARKRDLPAGLTEEDISNAINYFNGCCAVCGRQLRDLFGEHTRAMDHWIPLSDSSPDNPGTVPENIVPLCHGIDGCNNRKNDKDPTEWLINEFGKWEGQKILDRINDYFEWVKANKN